MQNLNLTDTARLFQTKLIQPMKAAFVAKDEIIDLMAVTLAAGENLFLLGPPGTAKSALVHEMSRLLAGKSFDYLLTRFTEPSEVFGPFDIRRLREGDLITNTEGMLPEADLVFLDELLNANSAILNSLLMALNERMFRRGREIRRLPALMFVGASNHLPEDEALSALFDRFLLRAHCGNVPEQDLGAVLESGWRLDARSAMRGSSTIETGGLHADHVRQMQQALHSVDLLPVRSDYLDLIGRLRTAGLPLSDRRVVKLQRVIAASAMLSGRLMARVSDLWVLRHIWDTEEQREWIRAIVDESVGREQAHESDHPMARPEVSPDPETLAQELDQLLANPDALSTEVLRDRLTALTARIEWVKESTPREALREQVAMAWKSMSESLPA